MCLIFKKLPKAKEFSFWEENWPCKLTDIGKFFQLEVLKRQKNLCLIFCIPDWNRSLRKGQKEFNVFIRLGKERYFEWKYVPSVYSLSMNVWSIIYPNDNFKQQWNTEIQTSEIGKLPKTTKSGFQTFYNVQNTDTLFGWAKLGRWHHKQLKIYIQ